MSGSNGNGSAGSGLGSCCETMNDVVNNEEFTPTYFAEEDGVFYTTVGFVVLEDDDDEDKGEDQPEDDIGWFDHAVFFCPFCGSKLQTPEDVEKKVGAA